jgi:hypothetical protein
MRKLRAGALALIPALTFLSLLSADPLCRKSSQSRHLPKMAGSQGRREDHLRGPAGDPVLPHLLTRAAGSQAESFSPSGPKLPYLENG